MDYFLADKLVILHVFTLYCHSLVQLSLPLWSVCSVFNETTHLDFKCPDGDSRDSTQHTSWLHFLLKPIALFQFTDALSDLSELFCCFWNLLVLFFRAVYEDDDDVWRCILGLCVFVQIKDSKNITEGLNHLI